MFDNRYIDTGLTRSCEKAAGNRNWKEVYASCGVYEKKEREGGGCVLCAFLCDLPEVADKFHSRPFPCWELGTLGTGTFLHSMDPVQGRKFPAEGGPIYNESVPFPGARNYGGHLSLQKFDGQRIHQRLQEGWHTVSAQRSGGDLAQMYSMEPVTRYPNSNKFNTLENSHQQKKFRSSNGLLTSLGLQENKGANGSVANNGISGVVMRPLDLEADSLNSNGYHANGHNGQQQMGGIPYPKSMGAKDEPVLAVQARNIYKSYGSKRSRVDVLKGLNLTVPQGAIYGLLGPSGCGKTTLLKCIVGMLNVKQGHIHVFGHYPGTPESGIPGDRVGYMPQEIALYNEFTIEETLFYFGRIYHMKKSDIQRRMYFLLEFLHLPKPKRIVSSLSGGQKRRVSFAVALLKEPPLLILDEPTVGVDPLLRQSIWKHLVTIANGGNTTIIITTHYIEEARQAHMVGLMRNGHLLAEGAPEDMMLSHGLPTLEEVFLKLCMTEKGGAEEGVIQKQATAAIGGVGKGLGQGVSNGNIYPFNTSTEVLVAGGGVMTVTDNNTVVFPSRPPKRRCVCSCNIGFNKIYALFIKSMLKLVRNLGFLGFQFLLPSLQIILFCLAIGRDPQDLPMAVVNFEGLSDDGLNFGDLFVERVRDRRLHLIPYTTYEEAEAKVKAGEAWGVIVIPRNFSQDLISRVYQGPAAQDEVIDGSTISIYMDSTNQQIAYTIREKVLTSFQEFSIQQMNRSGSNPKLGQIPINFGDPIYGAKEPNFTEFMAPGIILSVSYFMAVGLTALTFVLERKEGQLDRTWVAGVTTAELMISHFVSQFLVMVVQNALSLAFMIGAFSVPCRGPIVWVVLLTLLQGTCGMAYGLLISSFCDEENSAIMFALGSFYPSLLLSGIIWPTEGMPNYLQYISYVVPQTYATESLRALLSRGWGIAYMVVWRGFVVTIGWFLVFFLLAGLIFRLRR